MKKVWGYIVAGFAFVVTILAFLLKIKSDRAREAEEDAADADAAAKHSEHNAEALAAHQERTEAIEREKDGRDEKIENGDSDSVVDDVIAGNNARVPDNR